jgi:hypothetical protein
MSTPLNVMTEIQNQLVDAVKAAQEPVVEAVKSVAGLLPDLPELPFVDQLPTPEAVVAGSFGFAQRLIAAQGELALAAVQAWQRPEA